ncbi:hypothetical protein BGW38_008547, partial [Lunasporangiospora selenospora]
MQGPSEVVINLEEFPEERGVQDNKDGQSVTPSAAGEKLGAGAANGASKSKPPPSRMVQPRKGYGPSIPRKAPGKAQPRDIRDVRLAPFRTMEEYKTQMLANIRSGKAENVQFFQENPEDSWSYVGSKSEYLEPVPLQIGEEYMISCGLEPGLYHVILCLFIDGDVEVINRVHINSNIWDFPPKVKELSRTRGSPFFIRLLLGQQIAVLHSGGFIITVGELDRYRSSQSVQLCSIEVFQADCSDDSFDCISFNAQLSRTFINVWNRSNVENSQPKPAEVISFALSATGTYTATLSKTGSTMHLDLWRVDIKSSPQRITYPPPASTSCAHTIVQCKPTPVRRVGLSISWDGSQIALFSNDTKESAEFQLYQATELNASLDRNQHQKASLPSSVRHRSCPALNTFVGYAKFTSIFGDTWDEASERFLTCDGTTISIYSTGEEWGCLSSIQISSFASIKRPEDLILAASGGLFAWMDTPFQLSIWNIESGENLCLVSTSVRIQTFMISSDGRFIAVSSRERVSLYSTTSGCLLHSKSHKDTFPSGYFTGTRGIVFPKVIAGVPAANELVLADGLTLSTLGSYPLLCTVPKIKIHENVKFQGIQKEGETESTMVCQKSGSLLHFSYLRDSFAPPKDSSGLVCDSGCQSSLSELQAMEDSTTLRVYGEDHTVSNLLDINMFPPRLIMCSEFDGYFGRDLETLVYSLEKQRQILSIGYEGESAVVTLWGSIEEEDERSELLLCWYLENATYSSQLLACTHEKQVFARLDEEEIHLSFDRACAPENAYRFFGGLDTVIINCCRNMHNGSSMIVGSYIRYLQRYINDYPCPDDLSISVMSKICMKWVPVYIESAMKFFSLLLQRNSKHYWVPLPKYTKGTNPIWNLLKHAETKPAVTDLIRLVVDYCIEKAKENQDIVFIQFLCECMSELAERHPDVALRITRAFAYVRCQDRNSVIEYHKVIHPPSISSLWQSAEIPLDQCRNPIIQLQDQKSELSDRAEKNFTEEVFVVHFSLLWTFVPDTKNSCAEYCAAVSSQPPARFWGKALFHLALFNINPSNHVYIRPRHYRLTFLDNPAVEALIQYKWNSFGYTVWLARFIPQLVYYSLIASAAASQVYYREGPLLEIFIAIIAFSVLFLWLEFLQWRESLYHLRPPKRPRPSVQRRSDGGSMVSTGEVNHGNHLSRTTKAVKRPFRRIRNSARSMARSARGISNKDESESMVESVLESVYLKETHEGNAARSTYFRSPYNILDLLMYLLPIASSIHQIHNITTDQKNWVSWELSFCVIVMFLHLLSELRVLEVVCKYVTIVFAIISEIKAFFFVLAMGILAFALAIVHIVRGNGGVEEKSGGLPKSFSGAITTVFFILGGRYEPLANELLDEDGNYLNWPLQILLLTYFFFAVIVMLNMLIALINVAYSKGDINWRQTWLENRLHVIEKAENMSYHIPNFRETRDWFPDRIYYAATPYQVKQYWKRIKVVDEEIIIDSDESTEAPSMKSSAATEVESSNSRGLSFQKQAHATAELDPSALGEQLVRDLSNVLKEQIQEKQEHQVAELKDELSRVKGDISE